MEFDFSVKAKCKSSPPKLVFRSYKHYHMKLEKREYEMKELENGKNKWGVKVALPEGEYRYQIVCDGEVRLDYTNDVDIDDREELCNKLVVGNPSSTPVKTMKSYEEVSPLPSPSIDALLLEGPNVAPKAIKKNLEKKALENELAKIERMKKREEEEEERRKREEEEKKKRRQEEESEKKMSSYLLFGEIYSRVFEGDVTELDMTNKELSMLECEHLAIIEDTLDNLVKSGSMHNFLFPSFSLFHQPK